MSTAREAIDSAKDRPLNPVEVEEWGCTVHLRTGSAFEMTAILERMKKNADSPRKDPYHMAWVLSKFLCEADGTPIYPGEDYKLLGDRSFDVVSRLCQHALKLNGLSSDDEDEAETEKKLETEESDSGSDYL